jgi:hypothetical protein
MIHPAVKAAVEAHHKPGIRQPISIIQEPRAAGSAVGAWFAGPFRAVRAGEAMHIGGENVLLVLWV